MKILYILILNLLFSVLCQSQEQPETIKWLSFKEAQEKYKIQKKPFIIDLYTNWCGWCKKMDADTYSNPQLAEYINTYFYPIKFNAESKDTIFWQNKMYTNNGTGTRSTHDLAIYLAKGKMSYPSTIYINNDFKFHLSVPGYQDINNIQPFLIYTLENIYSTTSIQEFIDNFKKAFNNNDNNNYVNWLPIQEAFKTDSTNENKKILIYSYTDWCNGCKVMTNHTFKDTSVINYLNKNYKSVYFNAESKASFEFQNKKYNPSKKDFFHPFYTYLSQNNVHFPTIFILENNGKLLAKIPYYLTPKLTTLMLIYYKEDIYKNKSFLQFQEEQNNPFKN